MTRQPDPHRGSKRRTQGGCGAQTPRRAQWCDAGILIVIAAALAGWIFRRVLFARESFAFRDAAHYYYPLFQWCQEVWRDEGLPLWNPWENLGYSVIADATASLFYPGKLIFWLPGSFATHYHLYIIGHVLGAACLTYRLARHWGHSVMASGCAALAYAFGGSVLFQCFNVVYLIGAAWLPLAILTGERLLLCRRWRDTLALALVLAFMVLGGDPQMAYHVGLVLVGYAVLLSCQDRSTRGAHVAAQLVMASSVTADQSPESVQPVWRNLGQRVLLLVAAAVVAGLLSLVQVLPAVEWTGNSHRAETSSPRSLYELLSGAGRVPTGNVSSSFTTRMTALLAAPEPGSHHHDVFEFSVGPWRWLELLWPNAGGRMFPTHRRWMSAIPAEGRVWSPSLYMGLVPIILAAGVWGVRGGTVRTRWLSHVACWSALASLGGYGLGWLLTELSVPFGVPQHRVETIGHQVGGLYWWMTTVLPGYVYFRYPAKWWTFVALSVSLLAAHGWDEDDGLRNRSRVQMLVRLAGLSVLVAALVFACRGWWLRGLAEIRPDPIFGPLDVWGAHRELCLALVHTAVMAGMSAVLWQRVDGWSRRGMLRVVLLVLTCLDLAVAHHGLMPTAPLAQWSAPSGGVPMIQQHASGRDELHTCRIYRHRSPQWYPDAWQRAGSNDRLIEVLRWEIDTLKSHHHWREGVLLTETPAGMRSRDVTALMRVARRHGPRAPDGTPLPHPSVLSALATRYLVSPLGAWPEVDVATLPTGGGLKPTAFFQIGRLPQSQPRAWTVHDVQFRSPTFRGDRAVLEAELEAIFFPQGKPRDWSRMAVAESEWGEQELRSLMAEPTHARAIAQDSCQIARATSQQMDLQVGLRRPGLVVISDRYDAGWQAMARRLDMHDQGVASFVALPVLRVNGVMRGVYLPAGRFEVHLRYRPWTFTVGACGSATTGCLMLVAMGFSWLSRRRIHRRHVLESCQSQFLNTPGRT